MKILCAAATLFLLTACGGKQMPLEGAIWKLATMPGIPAEAITAEPDAFELEFNAAKTMISGRTNCNRFFGRYVQKGRELVFKNMGITRMACPDVQYEDLFIKVLDEVDHYKIKGSELMLLNDDTVLATFKAVGKMPAQ